MYIDCSLYNFFSLEFNLLFLWSIGKYFIVRIISIEYIKIKEKIWYFGKYNCLDSKQIVITINEDVIMHRIEELKWKPPVFFLKKP